MNLGQDESPPAGWLSGAFGLFGVILKSVTIDGWVVIGILAIMSIVSWYVMITKFFYVNSRPEVQRPLPARNGSTVARISRLIDYSDTKSIAGEAGPRAQRMIFKSPLYRIYHIGSGEIGKRVAAGRTLSSRSIQAVRASLDGGYVRENHHLNDGLVFLTISIAGGPFMGLLGTVVGVMITFAAIAATGEVNISAIAPGLAAALVATVAGLLVAIPALLGYNYLIVARLKTVTSDLQVFIDEFVTKMAEFYSSQPNRLIFLEEPRTMSMKADAEGKAYDDINVTPMVDLYLVLLLIFIIMTTAGLQGLKVQLPKESAATSQAKKKMEAISVTNSGQILLGTVPVSLARTGAAAGLGQGPEPRHACGHPRRQRGAVPGHHGRAQRLHEERHHRGGPRHETAQGPITFPQRRHERTRFPYDDRSFMEKYGIGIAVVMSWSCCSLAAIRVRVLLLQGKNSAAEEAGRDHGQAAAAPAAACLLHPHLPRRRFLRLPSRKWLSSSRRTRRRPSRRRKNDKPPGPPGPKASGPPSDDGIGGNRKRAMAATA